MENIFVKNNKSDSSKKNIAKYFKLMNESKKSQSISKIFGAFNAIEKYDKGYYLIPSKFHGASSLYTAIVYPDVELFGSLTWGSIVLQKNSKDINKYIAFKNELEILILRSEWNEAMELLDIFEMQYGTAMAIKEIAIAIKQQSEGTAKQIAYSRKLEVQCSDNAALFVRFSSERNEDRLTLSGYRRKFSELFKYNSILPLSMAVISWHCLHQLPDDEQLLSQLLSFEESGSIYDYYEIFVAVITRLVSTTNNQNRELVKNCLHRVKAIDDIRIRNVALLVAEKYQKNDDALTINKILSDIRSRHGFKEPILPLDKIVSGFFEEKYPSSDARRYIHKLGANFYHLHYFQAIFSHLEHKASIESLRQATAPSLISLASGVSLRSATAYSFDIAQNTYAKYLKTNDLITSVKNYFILSDSGTDALIFYALTLAKMGAVDELLALVSQSNVSAIDKSHLNLIAINSCINANRHVDILPLAYEISHIRLDTLLLVPIVASLEKILPGRLDSRSAVLFSIVASRILLIEDSDRLEDKLMVASEVAFSDRKSVPDWVNVDVTSRHLWITFLRDVLVVQNMLLIDDVNSLRDALNLRVEVLRLLEEIDPDNRSKYHEEVRDIAFNLSVDEGVRQVNTSRLNVNINGLTKWANEHCIDDYERYKELVIGETSAGDVKIKLSGTGESIIDQFATIPFVVADDQLIKLLIKIRNAYLSDPRNGLDAYISLRVRHGSLSGTLSRGLDTRQLLLLRKGENGPFEQPLMWIKHFELNSEQTLLITRAFSIFTDTFRSAVDDLLQNRLHVKNERNPQGEITVEITNIFVKGLKIDIVEGLPFDSFISTVFLTYKNTVSSYLQFLRNYLKEDFLSKASDALDILAKDVGRLIDNPSKQSYFDDAIVNARLELQSSIKVVCGWLEIAQKEDLAQLYTLSQAAEIGINYTKQVRNNFSPKISVNGLMESFSLSGISLVAVVDILFILLDNVYKHAGQPNEREISLDFDFPEDGLMQITMRNDLDHCIDKKTVAQRFCDAKELIANGEEGEKKLTEENQSGLPKLSRLVAQDRDDSLTFKLVDDKVEVTALIGYASLI